VTLGVPLAPLRLFFDAEIAETAEQALAEVKSTTAYLERVTRRRTPMTSGGGN
jgi:hypothetical protein